MSRLVGADDNGWATLTINQSLAGGNGRMSHSWSSDSSPEQSDKVRSGSPVVGRNGGRRQVWHFSSGSAELEATASNSGPHIPGNCVDPFHLPKFSSLNSTSHRRSVDFLRQPSRSFVEVERGGALRPSRRSLDVVEPARSYRCAREQKDSEDAVKLPSLPGIAQLPAASYRRLQSFGGIHFNECGSRHVGPQKHNRRARFAEDDKVSDRRGSDSPIPHAVSPGALPWDSFAEASSVAPARKSMDVGTFQRSREADAGTDCDVRRMSLGRSSTVPLLANPDQHADAFANALSRVGSNAKRPPSRSQSLSPASVKKSQPELELDTSQLKSRIDSGVSDPRQRALLFEETADLLFGSDPRSQDDFYEEQVEKIDRERDKEAAAREFEELKRKMEQQMIDAEKQRREHEEEEEERKVTEALKPSSRIIKMVAKMKVLKDRAGQNTDHGDELVPANKMQPRITSGYEEWSAQVACCAAARVEQASAEVHMERELEAVFVSYALFGRWEGEQMGFPQKCGGLPGLKFLSLCREAGLVDDKLVTPRVIRDLFWMYKDMDTGLLEFADFVVALSELSQLNNMSPDKILAQVMKLNKEHYILIRTG